MPRKKLIRTSDHPYHITNRSNNREYFRLPLDDLWEILLHMVKKVRELYDMRTHSLVLMENHFHMMVSTPQSNLDECMRYFNREIAKAANRKARRINHLFGNRYHWCLIYDEDYYWNCTKYIFRNPVKAGACTNVQDYKYSTLNKYICGVKITDFFHNRDLEIRLDLNWLNEPFGNEAETAIVRGLSKNEFRWLALKSGRLPRAIGAGKFAK